MTVIITFKSAYFIKNALCQKNLKVNNEDRIYQILKKSKQIFTYLLTKKESKHKDDFKGGVLILPMPGFFLKLCIDVTTGLTIGKINF